jgi:serine/threonine protein kinase
MSCDASFCSETGSKRCSSSSSASASASKRRKGVGNQNSIPRVSEDRSLFANFLSLYIFVRLLGSGAFGLVNLMQHRISGFFYAVKVVKKTNLKADDKIRDEINLGMRLDSEYVCKVHGYHEDNGHFFIVMEYLEGMDLCDFISKNPTFFMNNPKIFWIVIKSVLEGLAYLHSQGIAHMDIKPENVFILLDNEGNIIGVRLIDLGLSMKVDEKTKCFRGTSTYMAPEFFHFCWSTGFPADIWSLGITAFAMLMASLPISSRKKDPQCAQSEIYSKIEYLLSMDSFNPFSRMSEDSNIAEIQKFICSCFTVKPDQRLTADDMLKKIPKTNSQLST